MGRRTAAPARRYQGGFTLIELLVVIVILGILAGIVVFAVRGSGDKGRVNAVAIDARTIRTALEAYCAKNGHYPGALDGADPMTVLVNEKYLSEPSTYNDLRTTGSDLAEGNCNGTHYSMAASTTTTSTSRGVTTTVAPTSCAGDPSTWQGPLWCPTGERTDGSFEQTPPKPVQLLDGRVFALMRQADGIKSEVYSPRTGRWTPGPTITGDYPNMVVIGDAAGVETCNPNCGKVLVYATRPVPQQGDREAWYLYDPAKGPGEDLTDITPANGFDAATFGVLSLVQITGPDCRQNCGRILIASRWAEPPFSGSLPPTIRIFDPTDENPHSAFRTVPHPPYPRPSKAPNVIQLYDGQILIFGEADARPDETIPFSVYHPFAQLLDPTDETFKPLEMPRYIWNEERSTPVVLSTGEVLATGYNTQPTYDAEIFGLDPQLGEQWRSVTKCGQGPDPYVPPEPDPFNNYGPPACYALAVVGGKVLAKTSDRPNLVEHLSQMPKWNTGDIYLFDPGSSGSSGTWSKLGTVPPKESVGWGVTLDRRPGCEPHCGRVLVVGDPGVPAYFFTP